MSRVRSERPIALALDAPESDCPSQTVRLPSFVELYKTYFNFVWSLVRYLGVGPGEVDDVVQEVFITTYGRMSTIQRPESLRSWMYSIIRRNVRSHHRNKRAALITTGSVPLEPEMLRPDWDTPHRLAEQLDQAKLLWSLLEELDAPKREILVLAELQGMTAPEIAEAIDIPLNTVYSRLRVARQELEEALRRHNARNRWFDRAGPG
jgi:RNA polymerase sigma-70 factor, ECF subfamily